MLGPTSSTATSARRVGKKGGWIHSSYCGLGYSHACSCACWAACIPNKTSQQVFLSPGLAAAAPAPLPAAELASHVASGLQQLGLKPGDRLGLYSINNVEWTLTAKAADMLSGIVGERGRLVETTSWFSLIAAAEGGFCSGVSAGPSAVAQVLAWLSSRG